MLYNVNKNSPKYFLQIYYFEKGCSDMTNFNIKIKA